MGGITYICMCIYLSYSKVNTETNIMDISCGLIKKIMESNDCNSEYMC